MYVCMYVWEFEGINCFSLFFDLQTHHSAKLYNSLLRLHCIYLSSSCLDEKVELSKCSSWYKIVFWPIVQDFQPCIIHCQEASETLCRASKIDDDNVIYNSSILWQSESQNTSRFCWVLKVLNQLWCRLKKAYYR